ncbi:MAG TPA: lysylphosphatidylglycerol synthase transmembrane domain-containing protein [Pseudonocardiaceae bacterium]|nr:lysylphosphatidylglycerol synthase transmembrane domain-containing protein [Pseudonocardiaceae bacterium]
MSSWRTAVKDHWQKALHWVIVGAAVGYLVWRVPGFVREVVHSGAVLGQLRWGWLVVAVGCGVGALVVYGEMHRQLLLVGGSRLSVRTVQGINMVENAVSSTVPVVGGAGALAYAIDQLRRRGVDGALASWSVLVAGAVDTLTLAAIGALGLGWAHRIPLAVGVIGAGLVVLVAVGGWFVVSHPTVLEAGVRVLLAVRNWIPIGCRSCRKSRNQQAVTRAARVAERLALLRPGGARWLLLVALATVSWLLDYLTLAAVVAAVGSPVPLAVLAVGFLVVQGSIALQVLPGGAGLAETGLLAVLVAAGIATAPAAASVLIYRAISWLGLSMLGWVVYGLWIHTSPVRLHRHVPELSSA